MVTFYLLLVGSCKDPRYRSLQLHLGQKTTMLGPHVRASDSSIYKVLAVRSLQQPANYFLFCFEARTDVTKLVEMRREKEARP